MLKCSKCGIDCVVSEGTASVICPLCSMESTVGVTADMPARKPRAPYGSKKLATALKTPKPRDPNKKGRGWHLKGYFEFQGKTYSFGQEVSGPDAARLKAKYEV